MVSEFSSEIVTEKHLATLPSGAPVELLVFGNRLTVALAADALAVYRSPEHFGDPLGNGLIRSIEIPAHAHLAVKGGRLVSSIQSGCVNLMDDKVLLILPNEVRLYPDRASGLYNREMIIGLGLA